MVAEPIASFKYRPLFLVKPKTMSRRDITRAEKLCGVCIVECESPEHARYSEPPIDAEIDQQARAALSLTRIILRANQAQFYKSDLMKWFVDVLIGEKAGATQQVPLVKGQVK